MRWQYLYVKLNSFSFKKAITPKQSELCLWSKTYFYLIWSDPDVDVLKRPIWIRPKRCQIRHVTDSNYSSWMYCTFWPPPWWPWRRLPRRRECCPSPGSSRSGIDAGTPVKSQSTAARQLIVLSDKMMVRFIERNDFLGQKSL